MSFLSRIADRLILYPSTHPIDVPQKTKRTISGPDGDIEVWCDSVASHGGERQQIAVLKFTGNAGRAENVGNHPFLGVPGVSAEVWAVNHRGYGGSTGPASLSSIGPTCDLVFEHFQNQFSDRVLIVTGNSLGCLSALYLAAKYQIHGVHLRNGPPLRQMISRRWLYNWWNLGLAQLIAMQVPGDVDCVANAKNCSAPLLFVQSSEDRVVPVRFQNMIYDAYAGEKTKFVAAGIDHHDRINDDQIEEYGETVVKWIYQSSVG